MDWLSIESPAYWLTFTLAFLGVAQWESWRSERSLNIPAARRWTRHGVLLFLSGALLTVVVRLTPVAVAILARKHAWGVFQQPFFLNSAGYWVAVIATVVVLDLTRYGTHRLTHQFGWLWRIHRVHHSDPDFDVSTGARFHPLESLLVQGVSLAAIWVLSPPLAGVVVSEILTCGINFIEHANAIMPAAWERRLRLWVITPALHRIHHSDRFADQQKNFGELFPWWDRLFGTYVDQSSAGSTFAVGIRGFQTGQTLGLGEMLLQPLRSEGITTEKADENENAGSAIVGDTGIVR